MTIKETLIQAEQALRQADIIPYQFEAKELVAWVLGISPNMLWLKRDEEMPQEAEEKLKKAILSRTNGEPLQYIIGDWEFYSLPFKVGPGVLIPRADTELLVDSALEFLKDKKGAVVADLCSGSGCIAIAVAHERPDCKVSALELSSEALEYLRTNNEINKTDVNIIQADILTIDCAEKFDIILSNPPYIESFTIPTLDQEVLCEPHMALDGGDDGLDFYRQITKKWSANLKPGGALMVEIGINQHESVSRLFAEAGFENIRQIRDINGIERVIIGTLPL